MLIGYEKSRTGLNALQSCYWSRWNFHPLAERREERPDIFPVGKYSKLICLFQAVAPSAPGFLCAACYLCNATFPRYHMWLYRDFHGNFECVMLHAFQVVYYLLEPLVHKYVKDLRTPQGMSEDVLGPLQHVLVFLRVVTKERAQASWVNRPSAQCVWDHRRHGLCGAMPIILIWAHHSSCLHVSRTDGTGSVYHIYVDAVVPWFRLDPNPACVPSVACCRGGR